MQSNTSSNTVKICPACGAKNKSVYRYCNECGAPLSGGMPTATAGGYASSPVPRFTAQTVANTSPPADPSFETVSCGDMFLYTGQKPKLYDILRRQQMNPAGKIFCLPLFLLGIFFGFFGLACWYLYHKLYKQGFATLAAALLISLCAYISTVEIMQPFFNWYGDLLGQFIHSPAFFENMAPEQLQQFIFGSLSDLLDNRMSPFSQVCNMIAQFGRLTGFALSIILPFFAYETYRKTAISRIKAAYAKETTPNIAKVGGCNGGLLAVVIVAYILLSITVTILLVAPIIQTLVEQLSSLPLSLGNAPQLFWY